MPRRGARWVFRRARIYMFVCASNAYVFVFVLVQAYVFVPTHDGVQGATAEFSLRAGPT